MRTVLLPAPLLFALLLQTGSSLAVDNDFSAYPEGAQPCLYEAADAAGCSSGPSGAELNQCLCKNRNNFVYNTASCVARESPSDVNAVYETLSSNCAGTRVTLSVSKQAFLAAAAAATSTSVPTSTSTPTTPSSPDSPGQSADSGLSTGTKIGVGVGVGFGVIAVALAAWFIWAYQRRRRSTHSVHSNNVSGEAGPSYGGAGAFTMVNEPHHEYAQDNIQQEAAELAPVAWKPPAGYTTSSYTAGEDKNGGVAGLPLLAELGTESETRQAPVELPTISAYLGYSDRAPENRHEPTTPEGPSPATYSQGDLSPFTPSRSSEGGTYRS
ncbi:hypothetical protein EKO27_g901 [Xylaria grammica]|uniref:Extracellular membrane protein CFEM domain-containing protein n=1 Tax=Xylaria grammica TaxID=363999 RepID=A0A439DIJ7_9PEZI|nr:hypothetical protein EKO27_g901 [Xylaria grammica]